MAGEVGKMNTDIGTVSGNMPLTQGMELGFGTVTWVGEGLHLEKYLDIIRYHYFVQRIMIVFMGREGGGRESNWQS